MTGRMRAIIIFGVAFVLLAGATFWLSSTPVAVTGPTPAPTVVVWDYSSGTAEGISVQTVTGTIALQITNGKWRITAPVQQDADDLTVSQSAEQLKKPDAVQKLSSGVTDFKQYGLAPPQITVTLVLSGVTPPAHTLFVGKATVDGASYYVRPDNLDAVYLVANTTIEPLKSWLTTPPVALPTPTPLAPTILPTLTPPITSTVTLTGTGILTGTATITGTGVLSGTRTITETVPLGSTPVITGTEPAVGASPVSSPPAGSPGASPAPSGAGGGAGGATGTVSTPTP
ncbi:MAG: DUF4340 domain-containing protein [Chloroflexia bacterium]